MANTQDLRRRIRSIGNTMQLTRAMKMVAAAKLRRAQRRVLAARPYADRTRSILQTLAARTDPEANPLLQVHGDRRVAIMVVTSDKGLCGSFNAGITRMAEQFARDLPRDRQISVAAIGKKGRDYFLRRKLDVRWQWADALRDVTFEFASEIAEVAIELYTKREIDNIQLVYNEFKSAIQARPVVQQLLPVESVFPTKGEAVEEYVYEPSAAHLLARLLPHYVKHSVYRALLESVAAEHAARMSAMDAATKNAGELIESLTLTMNRVRQASITTEIIEVVSGAEALG